MGAADLVPGVSGGTVALITGIYDDLLQSISAVSLGLVDTWK
ncbi:MAG: undecaprenyl phosphate translocase family protein, partial [Flavobacteriales bacterium]